MTAPHKMFTLQALSSSLNSSTAKRGRLGQGKVWVTSGSLSPKTASSWDASCGLGNFPKRESLQKWLGEGAKGLFDSFGPTEQRSPKSLLHHRNPLLHRCNPISHQCKKLLLAGSKRPFAPSPNHFRELRTVTFRAISQVRSFPSLVHLHIVDRKLASNTLSGISQNFPCSSS